MWGVIIKISFQCHLSNFPELDALHSGRNSSEWFITQKREHFLQTLFNLFGLGYFLMFSSCEKSMKSRKSSEMLSISTGQLNVIIQTNNMKTKTTSLHSKIQYVYFGKLDLVLLHQKYLAHWDLQIQLLAKRFRGTGFHVVWVHALQYKYAKKPLRVWEKGESGSQPEHTVVPSWKGLILFQIIHDQLTVYH